MRRYVCLIIDIEKSKKYSIDNRNQIQFYMDKYIRSLNMLFSKEFQCEVMFSAGDEVQGLFDNVISALLYFRLLEMLMHPVAIRAGIGIGEWTIKMEPRMSTKQDGPAYHNARRAIEEVHDRQLQNIRIYSEEDDDMLYECETGIAMLQINRFSLGRERLEDLLSMIWNMTGERIRLVPIMDKDQFEAMARRKYRSIEVSFANIEPQLESGKNSLGTIMGLYKKFQGVSGSIKISVGKKRKGTLSIDEISEFVTDAMEEKSVKALKLHVKDDDSKPVEIIDLFDAIANSVITFKMENRTVLEYNYAAQLMIKSYKDKKIYLLKSIRV